MKPLLVMMVLSLALTSSAQERESVPPPTGAEKTGFGPLHIPLPPSPLKKPRTALAGPSTRAEWLAGLPAQQRAWVNRYCAQRRHAEEEFCGYYNTPLVASFDRQPVRFTETGRFAFTPGYEVESAFPSTRTPWIARDLNGNGIIDDGSELFGSDTRLPDGEIARDGFKALAPLDANGDGVVDAKDPAFSSLLLWADENGDHRCTPNEVRRLDVVITALEVWPAHVARCDEHGNCEGLTAPMKWRGPDGVVRQGAAIDVYLPFTELKLARR